MRYTRKERPSVVVVGAGLAGLTAARHLVASGCAVTVVEARDRIGGRAYSTCDGFADGQHGELGAELVFESDAELTSLCAQAGVRLSDRIWVAGTETGLDQTSVESCLTEGRIAIGGVLLTGERAATTDHEIRAALHEVPPSPHESVEQWMWRARLSPDSRGAVTAICRMLVRSEPAVTNAAYLTKMPHQAIRRVVGGIQHLANVVAKGLDIRLEAPVRAIRQSGGRVVVVLESGEKLLVNHAIVTVPASVLTTIGFDPPLAASHQGALTSLQRSHGGKVIGQYAEGDAVRAALPHCVLSDGAISAAWVSNPGITTGPAVVSGLACRGSRAILEDDGAAFGALDALVELTTGAQVTRIAGRLMNWSEDPFALGLGTPPSHLERRLNTTQFSTAERRLHFAGDYTDARAAATMEGAVRSGRRAADEVLRMPGRMSVDQIDKEMVRP